MKVKRILLCVLVGIASISYSQTGTDKISSDLQRAEAKFNQLIEMEAQKKQEFIQEKAVLEQEVSELKGKLADKETKLSKLRKDSEVRWHRDEYKKLLKDYEGYYANLEKTVAEKERRIGELTEILAVMSY